MMKVYKLKTPFSLADNETNFSFKSEEDNSVRLSFISPVDGPVEIRFIKCAHFSCGFTPLKYDQYEEQFLELKGSTLLDDLELSGDNLAHHYMISTNQSDWCEVICEGYEFAKV